jgi:hypothetical protein
MAKMKSNAPNTKRSADIARNDLEGAVDPSRFGNQGIRRNTLWRSPDSFVTTGLDFEIRNLKSD